MLAEKAPKFQDAAFLYASKVFVSFELLVLLAETTLQIDAGILPDMFLRSFHSF